MGVDVNATTAAQMVVVVVVLVVVLVHVVVVGLDGQRWYSFDAVEHLPISET